MDYVDYVKETQDVCSPKAVTLHLNIVSSPVGQHCSLHFIVQHQ